MLLNPFKLHTPKTLNETIRLYSSLGDVKVLAGGTFLLNNLKLFKKNGMKTPAHIISLRQVKELKGVERDEDKLIIKAMTTINDLTDSPEIENTLCVLKTICRNVGTNPIRNMATLGGNLTCRYTWTELGAVMLALDAQMHFIGSDGKEETMSALAFFQNAAKTNKLLTHVSIRLEDQTYACYHSVRKTLTVDVPLLAVCIKANLQKDHLTNSRVAINTGTSFAQRDTLLEEFLDHAPWHKDMAEEALNHLDTPIYDTRSDDYKKYMFRLSIKNAINDILHHK